MGKSSSEKKDRKMVKEAIRRFGPEIEAKGFEKGHKAGRADGLREAAELGTIAKVRAAVKALDAETEEKPDDGADE